MIWVVGAVPASAAFTADLKLGQTHPQVKELQQYLNNKGYAVATTGDGSPGNETTYMGPATVDALKRFQSDNGIEATGMVGVQTRIVLNRTGFVTTTPTPVINNQDVSIASTTVKTEAPSSASAFNTTGPSPFVLADLYPGMTHPQTLTLQRLLNTFGHKVATTGDGSPGNETTYMGPATVDALKRFQSTNKISPTGVVGPLTKIALLRAQLDLLLKASGQGVSSTGSVILATNSTTKTASTTTTTTTKRKRGGGGGGGGGGSSTPLPVASLSVSSGAVTSGASVTVTWSSTNATSCTGTNFSTGSATSGSVVVNPTTSTTYTLSCTGAGGTDTETASVTVSSNPAPTATLSVSASSAASGASITVTWSSANATACTGTNFNTSSATSGSVVVNPTTSTTYTVTCTGAGGTDDDVEVVTIVPAPVATFSASPSSVTSGSNVTLTWSTTNATACTGTNFSTGSATSGSVVVNPTATTTYTLSCTGTGGSDVETEIVTVSANPTPTATLSATSNSVASGASVTLTWSSSYAASCTGTNFSTGSATSGSVVVNPTTSTTYTVSCTGTGGSDNDSQVVTVVPAPVAALSVSSSTVASGAAVTVTWSSTNATACTGTNFNTSSATSGSVVVNPTTSTTYTVSCTGTGGSDNDSQTVTVVPAPVATLSVSSSSVASGAAVTITWSSTNATSCTGTNFSTGSATSGSVVVNPTATTTYTVSCTGVGGSDSDAQTVNVVPTPVATLNVSSSTVASGAAVTVTWSSTNATSCTGTNFSTGSATSGSVVVNPTTSTTYTLSCTGVGGTDDDVEIVTVTGGSGDIVISASPSRTSGVAPLAVFFDATGTTDPNTTRPFEDLEYRWNFDDPAGGATWAYGARPGVSSKNEATGGVAAHVFETPGTYTVTLNVIGDSGTESTDMTITVTDPDTVFSGTNTRCISRTGNFTGCPAGAQQVTTTDIAVATSHIATGRRILFRKGETWTDTIYMGGINGPGIIGSYGTGASPIFTGLNIGSSGVSDWRVMDVDFVRPTGDLYATAVEVVHPSSRMTFLRVKSTGAGSGADGSFISFAMNIYDTPDSVNRQVEHAIVDSEITGGRYAFYGAGDKFAMLGTYLHASGDSQHVYRSFYANKSVTSNNTFAGGGDAGGWGPISLVKQHAPDQPGAYSEYLQWSDNRFAPTNVYVSLGFGSENSITDQRLRNVVVERNWFSAQYNAQLSLNVAAGYNYTLRNNLFVMDNYWGTGLQIQHTSTGPATEYVNIFNNTFYKSDGGGNGMDAIQIMNSISNIVIRNNLAYAPNASSPSMLSTLSGPTNVTLSNNSTDTQVRTVSPNFSSATPVTIQHFDLLSGSYGRNAGYAVPNFSDLLNRVRPVGSYDMGALEAQ